MKLSDQGTLYSGILTCLLFIIVQHCSQYDWGLKLMNLLSAAKTGADSGQRKGNGGHFSAWTSKQKPIYNGHVRNRTGHLSQNT